MGTTVNMETLADRLGSYGFAYLITIGADEHIHTSPVHPVIAGARLTVPGTSPRARTNANGHPGVSLVWPPVEDGGYSLIVDGQASTADDTLQIAPSRAVLHRAAPRPGPNDSESSCRSDCVEL